MLDVLVMMLGRDGHRVEPFSDPVAFLAAHEGDPFDLLVTDLRMPGMDGLEVLRRAQARAPSLPVVLLTAYASVQTAVGALKDGAFDYVQKPFDNTDLRAVVRRGLELTRLERENRYLRAQLRSRYGPEGIVAVSPAMDQVLALVRRVARSDATVLISGESGTGKELVARAVHFLSERVGGPFEAVNVSALAEGVLESELFGHERGAFTGAVGAREGLFERAHGGTLFLDEVGELAPAAQTRLLRVLQEREVTRVGGSGARKVDVRVLCATHRDLAAEVSAGRFREDLYFRLAVLPVRLPPLRERPEDILPLAEHFLRRAAVRLRRALVGFTPAAQETLRAGRWPGNVRELENAVERGAVLAEGEWITREDLQWAEAPASSTSVDGVEPMGTLQAYLDRAAEVRIRAALRQTGGARAEAAVLLGVERTTLYRLMKRLDIDDAV
ncbi:MAG: sigma-54-dependent Fis family transcriptional regulator [Deltaproteobacteria bacterium]|nr:sigma-54-dependent Fis family transcriptional regulator [Deltaproteobacteria bacterium]